MTELKQLEWRDDANFREGRRVARNEVTGGWLDDYTVIPSEKYGGFNVYGLMKNPKQTDGSAWAATLEDAQAMAEGDYVRRQRVEAWREYMETNDPPGLGE